LNGTAHAETVCESLVVVKFVDEKAGAELAGFAQRIPGLDDSYTPVEMARGFYQYGLVPGYDLDTVLFELREDEEVLFAQPELEPMAGQLHCVYDRLLVAFQSTTSATQIDSVLAAYSLSIAHAPDSLSYSYLVEMSSESPADIFDIGNSLYESGVCAYAFPK
jgi:hypothetical protein